MILVGVRLILIPGSRISQLTLFLLDNGVNGVSTHEDIPSVEAGKRKNKKKNKKKSNAVPTPTPAPPPPVTNTAPPPRPTAPVSTPNVPPTNNPAPPQTAIRREGPPQSSRAQGKQPMTYAPPATNGTAQGNGPPPLVPPPTTTTGTGNRTSARAASKQPVSNYGNGHNHHATPPATNANAPGKPRPPAGGSGSGSNSIAGSNHGAKNANRIWSTNSQEERERIKEFWLKLGEQERRDLVKVEKEAVLKKMKEQQKHSCGCAVCGRKRQVSPYLKRSDYSFHTKPFPFSSRTAIEEELEVLYEAYYEDLEHYASLQQQHVAGGGPPPPGPGPFPGSVALDQNGAVIGVHGQQHASVKHPPGRGKQHIAPPSPASNNAVVRKGQQPRNAPPPPSAQDEEEYDGEDGDEYDEEDDYDDDEEEDDGEDEDEGEEEEDPGKTGSGKRKNGDMFSFSSNFTAAGAFRLLSRAEIQYLSYLFSVYRNRSGQHPHCGR